MRCQALRRMFPCRPVGRVVAVLVLCLVTVVYFTSLRHLKKPSTMALRYLVVNSKLTHSATVLFVHVIHASAFIGS